MKGKSKEWFSEWFDSPFYHILYKHRDLEEAERFINRLAAFLNFTPGQKALDAACGRGRHSVYLNEKGLDVWGIDLSSKSIEFAQQFEKEGLHFQLHDIREVFRENYFDYVFNLFTSFGYFAEEQDNYKAMDALGKQLNDHGTLVIDFLNPACTLDCLVPEEEKSIEGIDFKITRKIEDDFIVKNIAFSHEGRDYSFFERVELLTREDFSKYFNFAGLTLKEMFGSYRLEPFEAHTSERMIFIAGKKKK